MKTKRKILASVLVLIETILTAQGVTPSQVDNLPVEQLPMMFLEAVESGHVTNAILYLKRAPELVSQKSTGWDTPLIAAVRCGNIEMVEMLLTNHAEVNGQGSSGNTALELAVQIGDIKMVELLLNHKADVNVRDRDGCTPIVFAYKNVEIVKMLLAHGADINANGSGNTLLSQAVSNFRNAGSGVIQFILTNGVDVGISGNGGLVHAALFSGDTNLAKMLVPYYVNSTNPTAKLLLQGALEMAVDNDRKQMASIIIANCIQLQTNSLLMAVARGDKSEILSLMATNMVAVNSKDVFGWTPLHLAAMDGKTEIAELLIADQANVDAQDDISNTPLFWAAYFGHAEMVALLLRHKANTDIQGNTVFNSGNFGGNDTPLDLAIEQGFTPIAAMLITNGATLGSHKFYSDTPLHLATSKANVELMKLLIAHGANVNARSQASWTMPLTCLDIAVRGNSPEAVSLLIANGASIQTQQRTHSWTNTTLFHLWAEGSGNTNIADQLLAAGCDTNAKNGDGQTPLHVAVGSNIKSLWLLNHKVDANATDKNGQTPLHLVVTSGNTNAIQLSLAFKADVNATDSKGKTPLALLEDLKINQFRSGRGMRMIDFKAVENLLLKNGAKGPVLTPDPKTAPSVIF